MSPCRINTAAPNLACMCVDQVSDGEYAGYLYHKYSKEGIPFQETGLVIQTLDQMFDDISYPQASTKYRSFQKKKSARRSQPEEQTRKAETKAPELVQVVSDHTLLEHKGKLATFIIHVQFRQNATWQGSLVYLEKDTEERFNSVLELLKLIDRMMEL